MLSSSALWEQKVSAILRDRAIRILHIWWKAPRIQVLLWCVAFDVLLIRHQETWTAAFSCDLFLHVRQCCPPSPPLKISEFSLSIYRKHLDIFAWKGQRKRCLVLRTHLHWLTKQDDRSHKEKKSFHFQTCIRKCFIFPQYKAYYSNTCLCSPEISILILCCF